MFAKEMACSPDLAGQVKNILELWPNSSASVVLVACALFFARQPYRSVVGTPYAVFLKAAPKNELQCTVCTLCSPSFEGTNSKI